MDVNRIEREDLGKGSNIKHNVCDTEVDMYWKVAIEVLEVIIVMFDKELKIHKVFIGGKEYN